MPELLTVTAVLIVLAGILMPVLFQVKADAKEKQCWSNLHQIQLAISMYRTENNGDGNYGAASTMGLPLPSTNLPGDLRLPIQTFYCNAPPNLLSPTQAVYARFFDDRPSGSTPFISWSEYSNSVGENAVILADMNHGDRSVPITSPFYPHKGIGVRLNGQVFTRTREGDWNDLTWWE